MTQDEIESIHNKAWDEACKFLRQEGMGLVEDYACEDGNEDCIENAEWWAKIIGVEDYKDIVGIYKIAICDSYFNQHCLNENISPNQKIILEKCAEVTK